MLRGKLYEDDSLAPDVAELHGFTTLRAPLVSQGEVCIIHIKVSSFSKSILLRASFAPSGPSSMSSESITEDPRGGDIVVPPWVVHCLGYDDDVGDHEIDFSYHMYMPEEIMYVKEIEAVMSYVCHCNYRHWDEITPPDSDSMVPEDFEIAGRWLNNRSKALGRGGVHEQALVRMLPLLLLRQPLAFAADHSPVVFAVEALDSTLVFSASIFPEWTSLAAKICFLDPSADVRMVSTGITLGDADEVTQKAMIAYTARKSASADSREVHAKKRPEGLIPRSQKVVRRLLEWVGSIEKEPAPSRSMLLCAPPGGGKTVIMEELASQLESQGHTVLSILPQMISKAYSNIEIPAFTQSQSQPAVEEALNLASIAGLRVNAPSNKTNKSLQPVEPRVVVLLDDVDPVLNALNPAGDDDALAGMAKNTPSADVDSRLARQKFAYKLRTLLSTLANMLAPHADSSKKQQVFVIATTSMTPESVAYHSSQGNGLAPRFELVSSLPTLQALDKYNILTSCFDDLDCTYSKNDVLKAVALCTGYEAADVVRLADLTVRLAASGSAGASKELEESSTTGSPSAQNRPSVSLERLLEAGMVCKPRSMQDFDSLLSSIGVSTSVPENLRWQDFGGYSEVVTKVKRYLKRGNGSRGIVIHGPSGVGKTYLAGIIASELQRLKVQGGSENDASNQSSETDNFAASSSGYNCISIRSADLLSKYFGQTEEAVRAVFDRARKNSPCVLFFDDFDALECRRPSPLSEKHQHEDLDGESHNVGARVLSTFLNELDGVSNGNGSNHSSDFFSDNNSHSDHNLVVIVACQDISSMDEALVRPGRLSHHFHLDWPTIPDCLEILLTKLKCMPVDILGTSSGGKGVLLPESLSTEVNSDDAINPLELVEKLALKAIEDQESLVDVDTETFRCHGVSAATIDALCQKATMQALREAVYTREKLEKGSQQEDEWDVSSLRVTRRHFEDHLLRLENTET